LEGGEWQCRERKAGQKATQVIQKGVSRWGFLHSWCEFRDHQDRSRKQKRTQKKKKAEVAREGYSLINTTTSPLFIGQAWKKRSLTERRKLYGDVFTI